ncbi:MAG: translation initiation factor IF-2 N-terminal domain-containing protein, partial [Ruthenibacterium sp.]
MIIKYKLSDIAKDLGKQNKEVIDLLETFTGEVKKHTAPLEEQELNRIVEHYMQEATIPSMEEYLASAPAPKKPEPQPQKQPAAQVAQKQP